MDWLSPPPSPRLAPDAVHVWRIALDPPTARLDVWAGLLSDDERARAARFHTDELRHRFIAAHAALRLILAGYLEAPPAGLRFWLSAYDKPALEPDPGLRFNLTHSGALALLAVTRRPTVGVDVERVRPMRDLAEVAERFFSPRERESLRGLPVDQRTEAFYRCWTRKEAFIKAIGAGLNHPLDSFDVTLRPGEPARFIEFRGEERGPWWLAHLDPAPGYCGAVCVPGRGAPVTAWNFQP